MALSKNLYHLPLLHSSILPLSLYGSGLMRFMVREIFCVFPKSMMKLLRKPMTTVGSSVRLV